ncbi:MAG: ion channel [Myxococcota bacterium]
MRRKRTLETSYSRFRVVISRDADHVGLRDLYALILSTSWPRLFLGLGLLYFASNAVFATLFWLGGNCIEGARPGNWLDMFFFSIQTLSTIGYGQMSPITVYAEWIVSLESFLGIASVAVATGIIFTKFARPTAGMVFTEKAVIHRRDGVPCLVFRVANARGGDVVEATLRATALLTHETSEGHRMRQLHDLDLLRNANPLLLMSWTVIHEINERSPLYGLTPEDIKKSDVRVICSLTGVDGTFMQTVYVYNMYLPEDLVFNATFADVVIPQDRARFHLDMSQFNVLHPVTDDDPITRLGPDATDTEKRPPEAGNSESTTAQAADIR